MDPRYGPAPPQRLSTRVRAILLDPWTEWRGIAADPAPIGGLLLSYVLPLAAIGPAARLIGTLFAELRLGALDRATARAAAIGALVHLALSLLAVFVLAGIVDALAPSFGGTRSPVRAFNVAAFGATAFWIAGIFGLVPPVEGLALLGLYSLYLLHLGVPLLMRAPRDRALPYATAAMLCALVLALGVDAASAPATRLLRGGDALATTDDGALSTPGETLETAASEPVDDATAQAEAIAESLASTHGLTSIDPAQLQALLPATIAGFVRTTMSTAGGSALGIGGAEAEGRYEQGDRSFTLRIADLAFPGTQTGLSPVVVAAGGRGGSAYARTTTTGGRLTSEAWDPRAMQGSASMLVGKRFDIRASGRPGSVAMLKAAVAAIDAGKLEAVPLAPS